MSTNQTLSQHALTRTVNTNDWCHEKKKPTGRWTKHSVIKTHTRSKQVNWVQTKQKESDSRKEGRKKLTMKNKPPIRFVNDVALTWEKCVSSFGMKAALSHTHTQTDTTNGTFVFPAHRIECVALFCRLASNHFSWPICWAYTLFDVYH